MLRNRKNEVAVILFVVGLITHYFPSFSRMGFSPFVEASDAQIGIAGLVLVVGGIILYYLPNQR